jgi:hypothetical protein
MAKPKAAGNAASGSFRQAIEVADHLLWKPGLTAIKKSEGAGKIDGNPKFMLGGACIDDDCKAAHAHGSRWDYVIGYQRSHEAIAHFIEVHSAETSEVSAVEKKLHWLRDLLAKDAQEPLAKLTSEYHWVASGRINIPRHLPQYKKLQTTLRKLGLKGPVKHLTLA